MKRFLTYVVALAALGAAVPPAFAADPELERIEKQIWADDRVLERERIWVTAIGKGGDRLEVDVISPRADVRTFMRDRYGPRVAVSVIAKRRFSRQRTPWVSYRVLGPRRIRITRSCFNHATKLLRVRRRETARRVVVTVIERRYNGPQTQECGIGEVTIRLKRPLGTRRVVDGATGKRRPVTDRP